MRAWMMLLLLPLAGCLGDAEPQGESEPQPLLAGSHPAYNYPTKWSIIEDGSYPVIEHPGIPENPTGLEFIANVPASGGAGIAIYGDHAYVGPTGGPMHVVNVSDPYNPLIVATMDMPMRDSDILALPDGRVFVVSASGGSAFHVANVTDPANPTHVLAQSPGHNNHNLAMLPGTPIMYNSPSGGSHTDIWDLSNFSEPSLILDWENGYGCHDITFYMNHSTEMYRGYCAGLSHTQIWNVTNPVAPEIISSVPFPTDFGPSFSHLAMTNHDGSVMIVGDETFGGAGPGCDYYIENPLDGSTMSGDMGNLWFYDIRDESAPVLKGHVSVGQYMAPGTCTAHFGQLVEDTNQLVMSFYSAGTLLIDFTDLDNPRIVDQEMPVLSDPANGHGLTWDAQYYQGYVFTGDITRGMDIFRVV